MKIEILLFFIIWCVFGDTEFSGIQLSIREDILLNHTKEIIYESIRSLKKCNYSDIVVNNTMLFFTINTNLSNIHPYYIIDNITLESYELKNNELRIKLLKSFEIWYEFNIQVKLFNLVFISGSGGISFYAKKFEFRQEFLAAFPQSHVDIEFEYKGSRFYGFMLELFATGFASIVNEIFKNNMYKLMADNLNLAVQEFDKSFISKYQNFEFDLQNRNISINNYFDFAKTEEIDAKKYQTLFFDAAISVDDHKCHGKINNLNKHIPIDDNKIQQKICFYYEIFTAAFHADSKCKHQDYYIDLNEWDLKGEIREFYEIMPDLANKYSENEKYEIFNEIVPDTIKVYENNTIPNLTFIRKYIFTMKNDNNEFLHLLAFFNIQLELEHIVGEINEILLYQNNATIKEIKILENIDIGAKLSLWSLMQKEVRKINGYPLYTHGIKAPRKFYLNENIDRKNSTYLCIENY